LSKTGTYIKGKQTLTYQVKTDELYALVERYQPTVLPTVLTTTFSKIQFMAFRANNPFERPAPARDTYKRVEHRVYSDVTYLTKEVRSALIKQGYDYDITASIATLLYQRYLKEGGAVLPTFARLVEDRTTFRAELATFSGLPVEAVKEIVTSIINGAQVTQHWTNSIWQHWLKNAGLVVFEDFQAHPLISGLVAESKVLYELICPLEDRVRTRRKWGDGEQVRANSRGWHQFRLYAKLEDEVMAAASSFLSIPTWYVHDGFLTQVELSSVDLMALLTHIQQVTGYKVDFEVSVLSASPQVRSSELAPLSLC
jgi:hypothetical protein